MSSELAQRAFALGLHGLLQQLDVLGDAPWVPWLLDLEEQERGRRGLDRRVKHAKLGAFKPLADFDWAWPTLDRSQVEALFRLDFVDEGINPIFVGPNGLGKTMLSKNLAYRALLAGHSAEFTTASAMLNGLTAEDSASGLERRLRRLCRPRVLCIDEVGYLSYGNRHADLLFEVITRRYEANKPVIVTTNRLFGEWGVGCTRGSLDTRETLVHPIRLISGGGL